MNWTKHNALSLIKTTQQCRNRKRKEWNTERNNCKKNKLDTRGQPGIEPGTTPNSDFTQLQEPQ